MGASAALSRPRCALSASPIDLPAVPNCDDENHKSVVVDFVDHPIVSRTKAPCVPPAQFRDPSWWRVLCEPTDGGNDAILVGLGNSG